MKGQQEFEVAYKENGHIKKIRKKALQQLKDQVIRQITAYAVSCNQQTFTNAFEADVVSTKSNLGIKKKLPVLNINIKPIQIALKNQNQNISIHQSESTSFFPEQTNINNQNIELLQDEIELFKSQQDIQTFIQTQKNIALNIEDSLTLLLQNSLKICWSLIKQDKSKSYLYQDPSELLQKNKSHWDTSKTMMIKENLQKIEDKCLETLRSIMEERRKLQLCGICLSSKSNTLLIPCMHLGTCSECSKMIIKCPFCKQSIHERKNVYQ